MKKKILIVTALWGRGPLSRITLRHWAELRESPYDVELLAVGSEKHTSQNLAHEAGWKYFEAPNDPLSQKFNALFQMAREYEPDIVILTGSDNMIEHQLVAHIDAHYPADANYIAGFRDFHFHDIETNRTIYFPGYNLPVPKTIGAGRAFSRHILDAIDWRPWGNEILPRGLDTASAIRFKRLGIGERDWTMSDVRAIGCDFKMPVVGYRSPNLTPFRFVEKSSQPASNATLEAAFGPYFEEIRTLAAKPVTQ